MWKTLRMTNVTESEMRKRCGTRRELEVKKVVHSAKNFFLTSAVELVEGVRRATAMVRVSRATAVVQQR